MLITTKHFHLCSLFRQQWRELSNVEQKKQTNKQAGIWQQQKKATVFFFFFFLRWTTEPALYFGSPKTTNYSIFCCWLPKATCIYKPIARRPERTSLFYVEEIALYVNMVVLNNDCSVIAESMVGTFFFFFLKEITIGPRSNKRRKETAGS